MCILIYILVLFKRLVLEIYYLLVTMPIEKNRIQKRIKPYIKQGNKIVINNTTIHKNITKM